MMKQPVRWILGLALVASVGACSDGGGDTARPSGRSHDQSTTAAVAELPRPEALGDLPEVVLTEPGAEGAGQQPTFRWEPFVGASSYRLTVLGPDHPTWAWTGTDEEVTLGAGARGITLQAGSWWSVAALDPVGDVVGLSVLRAVSPDDGPSSPEPPPYLEATSDAPEDPAPLASGGWDDACGLLTTEEVAEVLGTASHGAPSGLPMGAGSDCSWERDDGLTLDIELDPSGAGYRPDMWVTGTPEPLDGLPEPSFFVNDGLAIKIGWRHGDGSVLLSAYAGSEAGVQDLARLVDQRLG